MEQVFGIYGSSGSGKTRFVEQAVASLTKQGFRCYGICSPARFLNGNKVGIFTKLIPGGETRVLAQLARSGDDLVVGKWKMFHETIDWAKVYLADQTPCDLWVIDEIGPYEIEENQGWASVLSELKTKPFAAALITYRPKFATYFDGHYSGILQFDLEVCDTKRLAMQNLEAWLKKNIILPRETRTK